MSEGRIFTPIDPDGLGLPAGVPIWEGASPALISSYRGDAPRGLHRGDTFLCGPWRLRVFEERPEYMGYLVERDRHGAWLRAKVWPLRWTVARAYRRLLLTAALWGLAPWAPNREQSWRDLYAVQRVMRRKVAR